MNVNVFLDLKSLNDLKISREICVPAKTLLEIYLG